MRKILLFTALLALGTLVVRAQRDIDKNAEVILEMSDGSYVRGWNQTKLVNKINFIEISDESKGKRVRYDNDQVARMLFPVGGNAAQGIAPDTIIYVQKNAIMNMLSKKASMTWLRQEYATAGIGLYSYYSEGWEQVNDTRHFVSGTSFLIRLGDNPARYVATEYYSGGTINQGPTNRVQIAHFFSKQGYPELANRVKNKEFDTKGAPIDIIKAWVEMYGKVQ